MNLKEARQHYEESLLDAVDIIPNTGIKGEWVLLMKDRDGKSYFLVSDNDDIRSFGSMDDAVKMLQSIGFKRAKLFF